VTDHPTTDTHPDNRGIPDPPIIGDPCSVYQQGLHYVTADELEEVAAALRAKEAATGREWTVFVSGPREVMESLTWARTERRQHPLFGARGKRETAA
jgi:hypothetical protein